MSIRRQYEQSYASFWRSLANFLRNSSGFKVSGVARQGSRNIGTHRDRSDLDVIFAIQDNPSKRDVYSPLVERIKKTMDIHADIGDDYNVIKIWKNQVSCDLVLRNQNDFQNQIISSKYTRI